MASQSTDSQGPKTKDVKAPPAFHQDPLLRRLFANSGWLLGARGINLPLGLIESIAVARLLGVEALGTLGIVMTFTTVANRLTSFRMNEMVVKYLSDSLAKEDRAAAGATLKAAMAAETISSLLSFALACALAVPAARWFVGDPAADVLIRGYALVLLANAVVESTGGALQVFDRFAGQATVNVLRKVCTLLCLGAAFLLDLGLPGVLAAYVLGNAFGGALQARMAWTAANLRLGRGWWKAPFAAILPKAKEMTRFALATNVGASLTLLVRESDLLWVSFFRTPVEAGYYRLATQLLKIPFAAGSPMTRALFPEIARSLARNAVEEGKRLLSRASILSAAWVLPVCLGLGLLAPWVIATFYGQQYLPAVPAVRLLLVGYCAAHVFFWTRPALLAMGRAGLALRITVLQTTIQLVLAPLLLPHWGYLAQAGLLSAQLLVGVSLMLVLVRRRLRQLSHELKEEPTAAGA